jgi:hypothetical protein
MFLKNFADIQGLLGLYFAPLREITAEAIASGEILCKSALTEPENGSL